VVFVFNIDDAPLVGAGANHFPVDIESLFGTDDGKRNFILESVYSSKNGWYLDLSVECTFFLVKFIVVVWVHFQIMEGKLGFDLDVSDNE